MASVVLVEPFYGGSHRAWADGWASHSRHDIALLTLPGEFWRWRLRGAAVTLAPALAEHVSHHGPPDVIVLTSMIDAAAFAGLARHAIGQARIVLYQHESQLLYPLGPGQRADSGLALTNWQSLVVADQVWFNSAFHLDALRAALPDLLGAQPSPGHGGLVEGVFARSRVLPPGVETASLIEAERSVGAPPLVVWNQRWDHDKNPYAVFGALADLAEVGVEFRLRLAGERARDEAAFDPLETRLRDRIDHIGYLEPAGYRELLLRADVVPSAADHEFFGMAIVEAIAAGAIPVLPNRLSFPELIEPRWHEHVLYDHGDLRQRLGHAIVEADTVRAQVAGLRESMIRFDVVTSARNHDDAVDDLLSAESVSDHNGRG